MILLSLVVSLESPRRPVALLLCDGCLADEREGGARFDLDPAPGRNGLDALALALACEGGACCACGSDGLGRMPRLGADRDETGPAGSLWGLA